MTNRLLASLPAAVYRRLLPHLEIISLTPGTRLFLSPATDKFAYFPIDSVVVSSRVNTGGEMSMAWAIGREGMLGLELAVGIALQESRAVVQFGGLAFRITAVALQHEFRRAGALQRLLLRYVFAVVAESSQLLVCTQHHRLEAQVCRFLGSLFGRIDGTEISITQTQLAAMMVTRRETITEIAMRLKNDEIIQYRRGQLRLVDRLALDARACGCAKFIREEFARVSSAVTPTVCDEGFQPFDRRISACVERRKTIQHANVYL